MDDEMPEEGITLEGNEFAVSAKETVSTGDYESAQFFISIGGEVHGLDDLEGDLPPELEEKLERTQDNLSEMVQRAGEARTGEYLREWE